MMMTNEDYMKEALKEALKAKEMDEVPVGAIVVKNGIIISRAHNLRESSQQANAHAEMIAIQKASEELKTWNLRECDLYVTLEPCMMCTGAIILSRIHHLYYGTSDPKGGCVDTLIQIKEIKHINHHPNVTSGIMKEECARILTDFFREKRKKPKRNPDSFKP